MAHRLSRKHVRDAAKTAAWRSSPDEVFRNAGISRETVEAAQYGFQGEIILPGDPQYDTERKLFNPVFQAHPSIILMCEVENDVRLALNLAWGASPRQPFTVRSGGHSTAGYSAGNGMLIDVSALDNIAIARDRASVTVGSGCQFGNLIAALDAEGLHVPTGECDNVCIGGFVQGGGYGFTSGAFGMNLDNAVGFRVLLADGSIVLADEATNRDLWWALRGGTGGNFGIVLTVTYKLYELQELFGWAVAWPLATSADRANAAGALMLLQAKYMRTAPAYLTSQVSICYQPNDPHGNGGPLTPWLLIRGTYAGRDLSLGPRLVAPLLQLPGAVSQYAAVASYQTVNDKLLNFPYAIPPIPDSVGFPNEDKQARYVARDLTDAEWRSILDLFVAKAPAVGNDWSYMYLEIYGGAINAYPVADSAFIHRDVAFSACLDVFWEVGTDPTPARTFLAQWVRLLEMMWNGHVYQNYPSPNVPDYRWNYWGDALDALVQVKRKYDPQGFFSFPQMVAPYPAGQRPVGRASRVPHAIAETLKKPIAVARAPAPGRSPG